MDQDLEKEPGEESTVLIWLTGIVFFAAIAAIFILEKTGYCIRRTTTIPATTIRR